MTTNGEERRVPDYQSYRTDEELGGQQTTPPTVYFDAAKTWRRDGSLNFMRLSSRKFFFSLTLRLISFAAILVTFIILLTTKQIVTVSFGSIQIHAVAKWTDDRTSVFYVYTLGILVPYIFITSVVVGIVAYGGSKPKPTLLWTLTVLDLVMGFLLMAAISSTAAIGLVAQKGAPKEGWAAVCENTRHYCNVVGVGFIVAGFGFVAHLLTVVLDIYILYKHSSTRTASY